MIIKWEICIIILDNHLHIMFVFFDVSKIYIKIKIYLFCDEKTVHAFYHSIYWLDGYAFIVCEFIMVNIWKLSNTSSIISAIHYEWNWYRILNKVCETLENF